MMKNEKKKVEKIKEKLFRKAPHTNYYGPWVPKLIKMFFIQKEKNTQNNHGPWKPNMILSYQALYITK